MMEETKHQSNELGAWVAPSSRTSFELDTNTNLTHILNFPKIHIKNIPADFNIESSFVFVKLIDVFNKTLGTDFSLMDMLTSKSKYTAFNKFMLLNALIGNIQVDKSQIMNLVMFLNKVEMTYKQQLRSVDRYYDEIVDLIYRKKGKNSLDVDVIKEMYAFQSAYALMKQAFQHVERETVDENNKKVRYFEHIRATMEIVMGELPNPNMNKIVMALLHDVIEDIPGYTKETLKTLYNDKIATGVDILSKKNWREYLKDLGPEYMQVLNKKAEWEIELLSAEHKEKQNNSKDISGEQEQYINTLKLNIKSLETQEKRLVTIAKERRDVDYFGHLGDIEDDDVLDVKFADRIHNLRTLVPHKKLKMLKKIKETIQYFLPVAKERNNVAYKIMRDEIKNLIQKYNLQNEVDNLIQKYNLKFE